MIKDKFFNRQLTKNDWYLITGVFVFLLSLFFFLFFSPNYYSGQKQKEIEIKQGSTLSTVVDSLYKKEIITNKTIFNITAFMFGAERKIKAGKYKIPNGLSYVGLVDLLVDGSPSNQKLITIPEGIWQHKLAGLLSFELPIDSARFMKLSTNRAFLTRVGIVASNLEGYLLPNTYYFYDDATEEEVIRKLKFEMDKLFEDQAVKDQMQRLDMTKHQILTLASIIEGESNIEDEFKTISGVYHNRLKRGMALQADPTIQYLKRNRGSYNRILYKDLEINSPYNTYMHTGLPPGPINNPGKDAVLAAIFPEETDYLFFVADGTGAHKFAKTLSEHLRNVSDYRKWRSSQK